MGPSQKTSDLPTRPKFSWDGRNVPWTDGVGPQLRYAEAVEEWSDYHDLIPPTSSNHIPKNVRGIILKSQLYGRAPDLVRAVPAEQVKSKDGSTHIVDAIYQRDAISILANVFKDFNSLISAKRSDNEAFKNFESRFSALVSKFNSHGSELSLPEPILAFLLLHSASLVDHQRISILASISSNLAVKTEDSKESQSDAKAVSSIKYESVASIIRQCESTRAQPSAPLGAHSGTPTQSGGGTGGNSGGRGNGRGRGGGGGGRGTKRRLTQKEIRQFKMNSQCHYCRSKGLTRFGHWGTDHNPDGSLSPNFPSFEQKPIEANSANTQPSGNNQDDKKEDSPAKNPKKQLSFMETLATSSVLVAAATQHASNDDSSLGPLVDDGAPYSSIGEVELRALAPSLIHRPKSLDEKPPELDGYDRWKYGSGDHKSASKPILGSVELYVRTKKNRLITIRTLVIRGSSKWVVGRNVTRKCNIEHMVTNEIKLPPPADDDSIPMQDDRFHSFIRRDRFLSNQSSSPSVNTLCCAAATPSQLESAGDWPSTRRIIDKVHRHVCGHASFYDMRTLLSRNGLWSLESQNYLATIVMECGSCLVSSTPPPNRRVSLKSLDREFNSVLCIDHFYLNDVFLFHMMDSASRFSAAHAVNTTSITNATYALQAILLSQFWPPGAIHADGAFDNNDFRKFLRRNDIALRLVPPRRHQKNAIEPRHGVIRAIFLRLKQAYPDADEAMTAVQSVSISNDLYGNDIASAFELAKGFTRPLSDSQVLAPLPDDIRQAHLDLIARRKLNLILRSKSHEEIRLSPGDLAQIYIKLQAAKRGTWTSPRQVLSIDKDGGFVVVPGRAGRHVKAAFEDVRLAPRIETLDHIVQQAIDQVDESIDKVLLHARQSDGFNDHEEEVADDNDPEEEVVDDEPNVTEDDDAADLDNADDDVTASSTSDDDPHYVEDETSDFSAPYVNPNIGDRVEIFWPLDDTYYAGQVQSIHEDGKVTIIYDDNADETLQMQDEVWRFAPLTTASVFSRTLESAEQAMIAEMLAVLGQRPFLLHHAQGFDQSAMVLAYRRGEEEYLKNVKIVPRSKVPQDANIFSSHTVYKIKPKEDESLKLKARIAPHGNEDFDTLHLRTDCAMCPPVGIHIVTSTAVVKKWKLARTDAKGAFHQSGSAS